MYYQMGIDVSKWQGNMDWKKAKETLLDYSTKPFAFIRAGSIEYVSGICYRDFQYDSNALNAPQFFLMEDLGFYWYFRANHDQKKQAQYFVDLIKEKFGEKPYNFKLIIDVEENGGLSPINLTNAIKTFILEVYRLTGLYCVIYTRAEFWNSYVLADPLWNNCDIWIARYKPGLTSPWSDGLYKIRDWSDWDYWQFEADGNNRGAEFGAESDDIDLNYKNEESTIPPTTYPLWGTIANNGVYIRYEPVINTISNFGYTISNKKVKLLGETSDGLWYKVEAYIYKQFIKK